MVYFANAGNGEGAQKSCRIVTSDLTSSAGYDIGTNMKTVAIIQARINSSRLPAKVLLPLPTNRSVLAEVVHLIRQVKGLDQIVVATPSGQLDDILMTHLRQLGVAQFRGSEHDVLGRYLGAARESKADLIMRITADCPMLNPEVCAQMLAEFRRIHDTGEPIDYMSNCHPRTFPKGWDCEIFTREMLEFAARRATTPYEREHVTPFIYASWNTPSVAIYNHQQDDDDSDLNFSLDTVQDYVRIVGAMNNRLRTQIRRQQVVAS